VLCCVVGWKWEWLFDLVWFGLFGRL
jgi:hypothetical protein